ncbi:MAG: hypothetical protein DRJ38_05435 [Thermoprotei archaeon]|nr:MAG: hypothetical protein DRJ38_05435 [Thermoprotei archaeon]
MEEYRINKEYLDKIIDSRAKATVGRVLKRIETIDDVITLKKVVKDVIYEEYRNLKETTSAFTHGVLFHLKNKKPTSQASEGV